jgi:hypothetical protein
MVYPSATTGPTFVFWYNVATHCADAGPQPTNRCANPDVASVCAV